MVESFADDESPERGRAGQPTTVAFVNHNQLAVSNWPIMLFYTSFGPISLIIYRFLEAMGFSATSKSFERGSHHKTLPHVLPIGSRVWCARLATNPST